MNLTILPIFYSKNNYTYSKNQKSHLASSYQNDIFISFGKKKGKIKTSREIALENALHGNNIKVHPETLSYIFNTKYHEEKRFKEYQNLGYLALEAYKRAMLAQKFPCTSEGEFNLIHQKMDHSIDNHIAKILFNDVMFLGEVDKETYANCLYAVLGAIAIEGGKDIPANLINFLNSKVSNILSQDYSVRGLSLAEKYLAQFTSMGYDLSKLLIKTKIIGGETRSKIYYNNSYVATSYGAKSTQESYAKGVKLAVFEAQRRNLDELEPDLIKPIDYRKVDEKRKAQLEALCSQYSIKINDLDLLNRAFITGFMPDDTYIAHHETYEILEYIGDAVLGFCAKKIINESFEKSTKAEKTKRYLSFISNANLKKLSEEMGLPSLMIGKKTKFSNKEHANLLEAIIGAIYLDGKKDGFNNAYEFLCDNFGNKLGLIE